jgi:tyrosyl-tRNA synthetase
MSTSSGSPPRPVRLLPEEACAQLCAGTAQVINEAELLEKLRAARPLRVKLGVDPTTPDLHLGHSLALDKMRQFQDLGHTGILIIGDFTAMIGDPSGRSVTRPALSHEEVMANAETYQRQAFKVLDPARTQIVFNGEWFELMHYEQVIRLNSRVTLQQILQREDFKQRVQSEAPVSLHELQYPLLQGWDSVMIQADVELGGTDQLFNILVGRDLQKQEGLAPQIVMTVPILEGLDGVQKMSKSLKNYIGLAEPPSEMFGKAMSISDALMERYYPALLREPYPAAAHPMEAKKGLATRLVARYHSEADAKAARDDFEQRFSQRDLAGADLPTLSLAGVAPDIISLVIAAYAQGYDQARSRGEVRRLVEGGSIQLGGEKITDPKSEPPLAAGDVLKLDKKRAVRIGG